MKKMLLLIGLTKVAPALLGLLIIGGVMLVPKVTHTVASWFEKDQPQIEAATWEDAAEGPGQDTGPDESPDASPDAKEQTQQAQPSWAENVREYVFEQFKDIPDMSSNFEDVEDHVQDIQNDAAKMKEEAEKLYEQASSELKK